MDLQADVNAWTMQIPVMTKSRCHMCPRCGLACDCVSGWRYLATHGGELTEVPPSKCECPHQPLIKGDNMNFSIVSAILFTALLVFTPVLTYAQAQVVGAHGVPPLIGPSCISAPAGAQHHTYGIVAYNPTAEIYVFDAVVFHSNKAGCAFTVESPSHQGGSVTGKQVYGPGELGSLHAIFDTAAFNCGRVQIDFGFRRPADPGMAQGNFSGIFFGLVYDYGVDCVPAQLLNSTCELATFSQIDDMVVAGGLASITLRLRAGYDNVPVYLMVYGADTHFPTVNGVVVPAFPQTLRDQRVFLLRAGPAQTISIPVSSAIVAWQVDAGCVPGPSILRNRQDYPSWAFLEAAVGNNPH